MSKYNLQDLQLPPESTLASKCTVGLDRDGVINQDLGAYCWRIDSFVPIPGSIEAIAKLRQKDYKIVIISDQGGIEKGLYTEYDVENLHSYMLNLFGQAGCPSIDGILYSASSRKDDFYAKPNIGMFKKAEAELPGIRFRGGFYVGDKLKDLKAAAKAGARPILVRTGYGLETEKELRKFTYRDLAKKTLIFNNLAEFVDLLP